MIRPDDDPGWRHRGSTALLVVGFVLAAVAGPLWYVDSVIADEDAFVALADDAIAHPDVRRAVARNVTDLTLRSIATDTGLADVFPGETRAVALPVAELSAEQFTDAAAAVLATDASRDRQRAALRDVHRQMTAETSPITIDLRPVLVSTGREVAGPVIGSAIARVAVADDSGRFVVAAEDSSVIDAIDTARGLPAPGPLLFGALAVVLVAAVALATRPLRAVVRSGYVVVAGSLATTVAFTAFTHSALGGLDADVEPIGPAIARVVAADYARSQLGVLLVGAALVIVGAVLGRRPAAIALGRLPGRLVGRGPEVRTTLAAVAGANPTLTRLAVWASGVAVVTAWPRPTVRVVVTVGLLTIVGHLFVWVCTSAGSTATAARRLTSIRGDASPVDRSRLVLFVAVVGVAVLWPAWDVGRLITLYLVAAFASIVVELPDLVGSSRRYRDSPAETFARIGALRAKYAAAAVIVAGAVVGAVALAAGSTSTIAAVDGCNGHVELCDRELDEVVFAGSHNSMSSAELGWQLASQQSDIVGQLDAGVRALFVDTHYWDGVGTVDGAGTPAVDRVVDAATFEDDVRPGLWLCHGRCVLGSTELYRALVDLDVWLETHPREVVILVIDDEVIADGTTTADTVQAFTDSGLVDKVHDRSSAPSWPTLGELIDAGERLLVFVENDGAPTGWYRDAYGDALVATPDTFADPGEFSCEPALGDIGNDLLVVNHWLTSGVPDPAVAALVNDRTVLLERVDSCEAESGRPPNVIVTDFAEIGDLIAVVDDLNRAAD